MEPALLAIGGIRTSISGFSGRGADASA